MTNPLHPITAAECSRRAWEALDLAVDLAETNPDGARALCHVAVGWRDLGCIIANCPAMSDPMMIHYGGDR